MDDCKSTSPTHVMDYLSITCWVFLLHFVLIRSSRHHNHHHLHHSSIRLIRRLTCFKFMFHQFPGLSQRDPFAPCRARDSRSRNSAQVHLYLISTVRPITLLPILSPLFSFSPSIRPAFSYSLVSGPEPRMSTAKATSFFIMNIRRQIS